MKRALIIVFVVLLIDQAFKIWIKTNMYLGQEFPVLGEWFLIHFTENNGMAFGLQLGGDIGKLALSVFRILAVGGIVYYLYKLTQKESTRPGLVVAMSLILAGAVGNILDSAFYGLIFNDSYNQIAEFMPPEGGYAPFLFGKVVDMLYFPIVEGTFPEWVPIWGGEYFQFFRPVFNIADSAITIGISMIILFQKRYFEEESTEKAKETAQAS